MFCECKSITYLDDAKYCHECGLIIPVCVNCKTDLKGNNGKFCHMCGELRDCKHCVCAGCKYVQEKDVEIRKDTQFLVLSQLLGDPDFFETVDLFNELLFSCRNSLKTYCPKALEKIWVLRRIVSTSELIAEQEKEIRYVKSSKLDKVFFCVILCAFC